MSEFEDIAIKIRAMTAAALGEGHRLGYQHGYRDGIDDAAGKITEFADTLRRKSALGVEVEVAPQAPDPRHLDGDYANSIEGAVILDTAPKLQPHKQRALDYVREHPGITAALAGSKYKKAMYVLAKQGLLENRGGQFFPMEESA